MTTTSKLAAPSQSWLHQHGHELQAFGTVRHFPVALPAATRLSSCQCLNRLLEAIRAGETQAGFAEHLGDTPLVRSDDGR
jgi:hypothetical protein